MSSAGHCERVGGAVDTKYILDMVVQTLKASPDMQRQLREALGIEPPAAPPHAFYPGELEAFYCRICSAVGMADNDCEMVAQRAEDIIKTHRGP